MAGLLVTGRKSQLVPANGVLSKGHEQALVL
jgi:hypothetical protein